MRNKIAEIITQTHKTPLEQADEILLLLSVNEGKLCVENVCKCKGKKTFNRLLCPDCSPMPQ